MKQCVVLAREPNTDTNSSYTEGVNVYNSSGSNSKYLVAYYVSNNGEMLSEDLLISHLSKSLPEYMIPTAFVSLETLPLTINGKLDRKALPDPQLSGDKDSYAPPRNELESKLCSIFASVLGLQPSNVGIRDDFFRVGGNSILAIKAVNKVNDYYKSYLKVVDIFTRRNVKNITRMLYKRKQHYQAIVKLNISNANCNKPNLFMVHPGVGGGCEVYTSLAHSLSSEFVCYGVDSYNLYSNKKMDSLKQLSQYYLSHIKSIAAKTGHFHMLGWSLGGQIALEIASILERKGHKNITVYLLDTYIANKDIESTETNKLEDIKFKEYMIGEGYDKSYVDKVIANLPTERKLYFQAISSKLKYTDILLFKANLEDTRMTEIDRRNVLNSKYNNIDKVISSLSQIKVKKMLNSHHGNILYEEEFLTKEIIKFKNTE